MCESFKAVFEIWTLNTNEQWESDWHLTCLRKWKGCKPNIIDIQGWCRLHSDKHPMKEHTQQKSYLYKTLAWSITWELARNDRQTKDALGTDDLSESTAQSQTRRGSFIVLPSEKQTSKSGNFTAFTAGIITLLATEIYRNHR